MAKEPVTFRPRVPNLKKGVKALANYQLTDTFKAPYAYFTEDADNNPVSPAAGDAVTIVSSAPASASVVPDATPDPTKYPAGIPAGVNALQTGFIVGGAALAVGTSITATLTLATPPAAGQPAPEVLLVDTVAGAEVTGGLSLGTQVSQ